MINPSRPLTERDKGILTFMAWGLSRKQIAHEAGCSLKTIDDSLRACRLRTGIRSTARLIHFAIAMGLCPLAKAQMPPMPPSFVSPPRYPYAVYMGGSEFTNRIATTNNFLTVPAVKGQTYRFAASTVGLNGVESDYSATLTVTAATNSISLTWDALTPIAVTNVYTPFLQHAYAPSGPFSDIPWQQWTNPTGFAEFFRIRLSVSSP